MVNKTEIAIISLIVFFIFISFNLPVAAFQQGELVGDQITINSSQDSDNSEVIAEGNVSMNYKGMELQGDYARFNNQTGDILVKGNVKLKNKDYVVTGDKLEGNLEQEKFKVTGETVKVTGDQLLMTSGLLTYNNITGIFVMNENRPFIQYKELEANADKITYDTNKKEALLTGNVKGKRNGQKFSATKVTVDVNKDKVLLSGQASLKFSDRSDQK